MKPKQRPLAFEVVFSGPDVYPDKVALRYLSRALSAIRRLAAGEAEEEESQDTITDSPVGLVKVKRSASAVYQFAAAAPELLLARFSEAGRVIANPEEIGDSDYILSPVEELSAIAKSLHCTIVLRKPDDRNAVLAKIEPNSYEAIAKNLLITSDTNISGRVERAGGSTGQKCSLRVPGRARLLYCEVETVDVVRELGKRLYQEVAVSGTATWLKTNWKISHFKIKSVWQPRLGSAKEARDALREAGAKGWDQIEDPESFIKEVSGN